MKDEIDRSLPIIGIIFIVSKLFGVISFPWLWILAPLLLCCIFNDIT